MHVLIGIALKSLLLAGMTLGLLQLMKQRSAAERSWVAHIGLLALVIMAFAPLVLPSWNIQAPAIFGQPADAPAVMQSAPAKPVALAPAALPASQPATPATAAKATMPSLSGTAAATALYAVPAAILLLITFLALARLIALRARADVLVDGHWLSALARAQRRMGFKHGTALLTSDELASPISWGLMRPVILLNSRAVEATDEAEAIIAHELAHVARMDWIKLLLARIATALFWFNPLVWLLAREAHQLREETADDTVLAANIVDTDYAQLLVGVARHECPGLLLGAHGVAPSKSSLARRVARVLDGKSVRGPVARSFALGVFVGAVVVAAPLAALTLTPAAPKWAKPLPAAASSEAVAPYYSPAPAAPADLAHVIASGVSTSVSTAVAAATAISPIAANRHPDFKVTSPSGATVESRNGVSVSRAPSGATVTVYPPDAQGRRKMVAVAPNGATAVTYVDEDDADGRVVRIDSDRIHQKVMEKLAKERALNVTPEYIGAMRAAVPALARVDADEFASLRAVGVTPDFARSLATAGLPGLSVDDLVQARAVGVTGDYIRGLRAVGVRGDMDDFVQLRAVGVDPAFAARARASGTRPLSVDELVEMRALGVAAPPAPPRTPPPPLPPRTDNPGG